MPAYALTILLYLLEISGMFALDNNKEKRIHIFWMNAKQIKSHNNRGSCLLEKQSSPKQVECDVEMTIHKNQKNVM